MEWILTHHLSSKNLTPGEKLAMMDEFKEEVRVENEKKILDGYNTERRNQKSSSLQLEGGSKKTDRTTYTDNQVAKKAGVGTGTIARFNRVMSSDKMHGSVKNEEIKKINGELIYVVSQFD